MSKLARAITTAERYAGAYADRGGHPDLMAQALRQALTAIDHAIEDAPIIAHPATRSLLMSALREARCGVYDAITMEAGREGDKHLSAKPPPCSACAGSGRSHDPEASEPCSECHGEGVRRVAP